MYDCIVLTHLHWGRPVFQGLDLFVQRTEGRVLAVSFHAAIVLDGDAVVAVRGLERRQLLHPCQLLKLEGTAVEVDVLGQ